MNNDPEANSDVGRGSSRRARSANQRMRAIIVVASVLAVSIVAIIAFVLWNRSRSGAGRPVPAPQNLTADNSSPANQTAPTEATITLSSETAQNARIKIETVSEQLIAGQLGSGLPSPGTVQANLYRTTPVVSLVGGIVRRVTAELGENVRQGHTMVVIFSDELAMSQSRYLSALADLDEHHKHHARTVKLVEIGAASREEVEQATTKLKTAEAEVAAQRQRLMLLGLSAQRITQLKSPSQVNSEVSLPAPVSGTVIARSVNPGEVIATDKEVMRIADLSSVWVIAQVFEKDLGKIRVGSGVSITSDAYPGRIFRGQVTYVDPVIDQATRTAQVRAELANPGQLLKVGMFVNVAFATVGGSGTTMTVIPKNSVQNINNQQVVFLTRKEPNVFTMRPVRIGAEINGFFPVFEGLVAGDQIVTEGSFLLRAEWLKLHASER